MKNALMTTAAAALLLASQGAFAQPQNRGEGPGAGPQAPGPGTSGPSAAPSGPPAQAPGPANPGRGNSANAPGQPGPANAPRAEQRPAQQQAQPQPQNQPKTQQKAEQKGEPKADAQRTGESKQPAPTPRADAKGKDADQNRTARDATPKADAKDKTDAKDTARNKDADRAKDPNRSDTAQGKPDDKAHGDRMAGHQDLRQARERLDTQQRVRLHDAFDRRTAKTNIRVNVNIGTRVPRNVHLVRVPSTVISFFPYYRDYSYFVVEERVYIVNPRSYEVVDIIDDSYGRGQPVQQQARLNLSDRQIEMVREAIASSDIRPESLRLRLALGAEIPRDVELHRFPGRVVDDVRDLETYRFVLVDDQIVIVKPDDRSIVLVIDRT